MRLVSESNENLIGFIASTVEKLRDDVENMRREMATKADLARLEGKLTEKIGADLGQVEGRLSEKIDTDLARLEGKLSEKIDTDLARLEGKLSERIDTDLARLEGKLSERIEVTSTSIRGDVEQTHLRLDTIEHSISSRFEHVQSELSRLRSAVYLLGRDQPDVLRFLGQTEPN